MTRYKVTQQTKMRWVMNAITQLRHQRFMSLNHVSKETGLSIEDLEELENPVSCITKSDVSKVMRVVAPWIYWRFRLFVLIFKEATCQLEKP